MAELKDAIWRKLKEVNYPGYNRDIVSFGLVQRVAACDGVATVDLDIGQVEAETQREIVTAVRDALQTLPGLEKLKVGAAPAVEVRPRLLRSSPEQPSRLPGVKRLLAVGSGKGGVGKSTVTVNLAVALAQQGLAVGLMDADAYGPNIPRMMGVERLPRPKKGRISPALAHGVRLVSIGFMVDPDTPLAWRGPMTDKMVRQFLQDVDWGELDALLVDLPPSTGDIPIALSKYAPVDGAILVVTPQTVAVDDARKAIGMFRRLKVPILGVVENMSYFVCDQCGARHDLFGQGGGRTLAAQADIPFLGEIPLEPLVREGGDQGRPAVLRADSAAGHAFRALAERLRRQFIQFA